MNSGVPTKARQMLTLHQYEDEAPNILVQQDLVQRLEITFRQGCCLLQKLKGRDLGAMQTTAISTAFVDDRAVAKLGKYHSRVLDWGARLVPMNQQLEQLHFEAHS